MTSTSDAVMMQPQTSGMPKSNCKRDGRADDFRQIAGRDRDLAEDPEEDDGRLGIMIAAGLGEVASGGDPELDAEMLQQDRHEIGDHDDAEQRVTKLRAARQVGRPIARVHVADRDEKTRAGERRQFAPEGSGRRDDDAAMRFRERNQAAATPPAARLHRLVNSFGYHHN